MKKLLLFIFGLFFLTSCSDHVLETNQIMGTWNWVSSSGGIAGVTYTPESTGDNIILEFTRDSVFREFRNDTLLFETGFSIITSTSIYDHNSVKMLSSHQGSFLRSIVFDSPNDLILRDEVYDGFSSHYHRIK